MNQSPIIKGTVKLIYNSNKSHNGKMISKAIKNKSHINNVISKINTKKSI